MGGGTCETRNTPSVSLAPCWGGCCRPLIVRSAAPSVHSSRSVDYSSNTPPPLDPFPIPNPPAAHDFGRPCPPQVGVSLERPWGERGSRAVGCAAGTAFPHCHSRRGALNQKMHVPWLERNAVAFGKAP